VRVFGPFYPPALQSVVNHAERLSDLLAIRELTPPSEEWAGAWTTGRADEIVRFAEHVIGLWRERRLGERGAASMLEGYLAVVHEGLARHFGREPPSCCEAATAETAPHLRRYAPLARAMAPRDARDATALATVDSLLLEEAFFAAAKK
jgi:hypothetical protein